MHDMKHKMPLEVACYSYAIPRDHIVPPAILLREFLFYMCIGFFIFMFIPLNISVIH